MKHPNSLDRACPHARCLPVHATPGITCLYTRHQIAIGHQVDGVQPMVTLDDCLEAEDICKADASFQKLMADRYGITDMAVLACDPWYYGGRYSTPLTLEGIKSAEP